MTPAPHSPEHRPKKLAPMGTGVGAPAPIKKRHVALVVLSVLGSVVAGLAMVAAVFAVIALGFVGMVTYTCSR